MQGSLEHGVDGGATAWAGSGIADPVGSLAVISARNLEEK